MNEEARLKLWQDYEKNPSSKIREQLIIEYSPLVKIVAGRLLMYLGNNVEFDDLVGYGVFGLIDAIDKFSLCKGVKFETYASLRIRGSIYDQIRKMDWIPRTIRQKQKSLDNAFKKLETELGRTPTNQEMAAELQVSEDEFINMQEQTKVANLVSLEEFMEQGSEMKFDANSGNKNNLGQPEKAILKGEIKELLVKALDDLTENEKKIILLYYYEELTLKEVSVIIGVSESRISQLHTRALGKMKAQLGEYSDILNII